MKKRLKKIFQFFVLFILFLIAVFFIADFLFPISVTAKKNTQTVVAQDNTPLWRFADENGIWRYPVTLEEVPDYYLDVLLNYEDRHFYNHFGVNPISLFRAGWQNISNNRIVSGGSTISMQVARLLYPHDRTLTGKLKQIFRTLQLELHYSKKEILNLYINHAPYGGTIEGIGAASWSYFGKPPSKLSRSEAVLLAVLPQAPSRLRPDRYPERAQQARDKVLDRMEEFQVWPKEIIEQTRQDEVWVKPREAPKNAPLLAYRLSRQYPNDEIIHSTIDLSLQRNLEDMVINRKKQLPPNASMAILVVDHTDMNVKAYIGSVDFNDQNRYGQVDMISALRSPGSTLKPFMYAFAIDEGMIHSESLLQDVPRMSTDYRPTNFDDGFYGPVSASEALKKSLNLPAVQLIELYGPKRFTGKLASVGLNLSSIENIPNLSYILGGASLRMDELVSAYSAFARKGNASSLRFIQNEPLTSRPLISEGSAWMIQKMLGNVKQMVYKTGTSYGYRDAWAVGINPRYIVGVWIGRPDGTPVLGQYGSVSALPILLQVNSLLLNKERRLNRPLPVFKQPDSVTVESICWPIGQPLPADDENCHRQKRAFVLNHMVPPTLATLNQLKNSAYRSGWVDIWVNEENKRVASDCEGAKKKTLALWPVSLDNWLLSKERRENLLPPVDPNCPVMGQDIFSPLSVDGLEEKQLIRALPGETQVTIDLNSDGGYGKKTWFLDGNFIVQSEGNEKIALLITKRGNHKLLVIDESGQIVRIKFTFD